MDPYWAPNCKHNKLQIVILLDFIQNLKIKINT